ncbi:hypothetical protein MmTuc01_3184 [Methanosarcina mazei Tuc01]|uniref:Uncharacterized protein n=1 Tax=Methanosarcina mazei Tuc01 TaxID=1236903 RepID=M1Q1M0_METMZ|nr:hypothetical protein MmTuc01_3184 [Methanosarcina mazei Tuc01]
MRKVLRKRVGKVVSNGKGSENDKHKTCKKKNQTQTTLKRLSSA